MERCLYDSVGFCCVASINIITITPLAIVTILKFLTFNNTTFSGLSNCQQSNQSWLPLGWIPQPLVIPGLSCITKQS